MKIKVQRLLGGEKDLYVSKKVFDFLRSFTKSDNTNEAIRKLDYLAKRGFDIDGNNIRREDLPKVYRIRLLNTIRIIGFYHGKKFVAIDFFLKNEQKLTRPQRKCLNKVGKIIRDNNWEIGEFT